MLPRFPVDSDPLRQAVRAAHLADETALVRSLADEARLPAETRARGALAARKLVEGVRRRRAVGLDAFLKQYGLSTEEGVVLMCLAEALLRIPDAETRDRLIRDKIGSADWNRHLGQSDSLFVNAATWALMLTGRVTRLEGAAGVLPRLVAGSGEPVIRQALTQAMRILGRQFVMGRTVGEALDNAEADERKGYRHSFDMLGEAAYTAADAERYLAAYAEAIVAIGHKAAGRGTVAGPGISVKLSALHPRYEFAKREAVVRELVPRVVNLAVLAARADLALCVDAEEADRLDISLDVMGAVFADPQLAGWEGLGMAVQAYQKRALPVIDWLADQARRCRRRIPVRLVKGAYWDAEIKRGQERGLPSYPVFTRKPATDVSFLASARRLLGASNAFFPQFATHNAHTVAAVMELAGERRDFEFQRLHGMGEALYDQVIADGYSCRVYAPVGSHEDLLPYLVRRLLENGANTSFVNRIADAHASIEDLTEDPIAVVDRLEAVPHPRIPLPGDLYRHRRNSAGVDFSSPIMLAPLAEVMTAAAERGWQAGPVIGGIMRSGRASEAITDPSDRRRTVGITHDAGEADIEAALAAAWTAAPDWDKSPADRRASVLERAADLFTEAMPELMALCVREAGKTVPDAVAEVREAVDYCRYYAERARADFAQPLGLPGPTGESNRLALHGRGVFACISPWNFPLAIFTGQVTAALAAGNAVVAKPAEQTPLIAARAVALLHAAGVPVEALHLLPGSGPFVGGRLIADERVGGVAFTGSTETAQAINRGLAARAGPIIPLIAETGGQNVMIVDSSALAEQVVADVMTSSFQSAGQRCSALRVLCLQEDCADRILEMLAGAMAELDIGDPWFLSTDVGPVIDAEALAGLDAHVARVEEYGKLICRVALPPGTENGTFFSPQAFLIEDLRLVGREVFGPVLHVVRFRPDRLDTLLDAVANARYGLTMGIHSRIDRTIERIIGRARVGNIYVNRSMIGAVVGTQPFGGEGLSGTGPKAGGPHYLPRFATERVVTVNTTAAGGNASLLSLGER